MEEVYIVSMKYREYFDEERYEFDNIAVFNCYANAFKYIQIRYPDVYRELNGVFTNKKRSVFFKIEKFNVRKSAKELSLC